MSFTSSIFVLFLIIVFSVYWAIPNKYRWFLLLVSGYYFYMSWNVKYAILIFITTFVSWICALLIEKSSQPRTKKWILAAAVVICFGILFVFKYFNWFFSELNTFFSWFGIPFQPITLMLLLPVGISFYTFQTMSYVVDVYRGEVEAERNLGIYAAFVVFFPQLVAGPIERSRNLLCQIKGDHSFHADRALDGAKLLLWGYFKKLVIADLAAKYVNQIYGDLHSFAGFGCMMAILMFTVQIYCDFSGYSDIAIGTGKLLDIDLMTNFKSPYWSSSIREFWSRWHISLSTWFRDYVYIPLGGNRCSKGRRAFNLMTTMLVSGLWHGAGNTFIIWGGMHGIAQLTEDLLQKPLGSIRRKKFGRGLLTVLCFAFCNVAWVFFRAESFSDAFFVLTHCLDGITSPLTYVNDALSKIDGKGPFLLFVCFTVMLAVYDWFNYDGNILMKIKQKSTVFQWTFYVVLGLLFVFFSQKGVPVDFVYFQF